MFSFFFLSFSLWGKFGERQNKPVTHCITQPADLFRLLDDPVFQISAVCICSEDVMEVVTTTAEDECERSFKTNVFVAAFTTSLARLKLYEALDFLGDRALYYDTDSVIYKTKPGQEKLPLGSTSVSSQMNLVAIQSWNFAVAARRIMDILPRKARWSVRCVGLYSITRHSRFSTTTQCEITS